MAELGERTLSYVAGDGPTESFVAPYLALVLEADRPLASPARISIAEVDEVAIGRGERAVRRDADGGVARVSLAVADGWMSSRHVRIARGEGGWVLEDLGSKNGTRVGAALVERARLVDGDLLEVGATLLVFRDRERRRAREPADVDGARLAAGGPALATLVPSWGRALDAAMKLAASKVPIVLHGESGTGKEVLARALHGRSGRGPFVAVNAGALPETLVEAELFGHTRGAFSGASEARPGLVRAAHGGTLFLDEISELPLASQVKLLRVLQEGEVTPVGASAPIPVDVRVVSASHRALSDEVAAGRFRADLYARIAGHTIEIPPLRARREDLGLVIGALLRRHLGEGAERMRFERDAARALVAYDWPLNVRELEQALAAAIALADDGRVRLEHLPAAVRSARPRAGAAVDPDHEIGGEEAALRAELTASLHRHAGNVSAVARELGKDRVQIRRWCRRFGLDAEEFRAR